MFHAFAAPVALLLPLRSGTSTYYLSRFSLDAFTKSVAAFRITDFALVPPILTTLLRSPEVSASLKSVRHVLCAGAPITAAIQSKLYAYLHPDATIAQVWGATEVGWVTTFDVNEKDESGSVGTLLPGVQMRLAEASELDGVISGEALIKSPSVFTGYLDNEATTAECFDSNSFYRTGDFVSVHDGKVYIQGRIKEIMKVNGWQVAPAEIETVLLNHQDVLDAAVVGSKHIGSDGLEVDRPKAYVVRVSRSGKEEVGEQELMDFVASKMIAYKRLTGGVVFVDEIPRNPTGKILRRMLQEQ
jgi:4-coumarate--CoA ligase